MNDNDLNYYRQRAEQERRVAVHCADAAASCAHRSMARAYEALVADASRSSGTPFMASGAGVVRH